MSETYPKNKFDQKTMQANFSAILYLLTEQQALIGKLLQTLLESGVINGRQLDKVTDIAGGEDGLIPTYTQLYNRFATYYLRTKQVLDENEKLVKEAFEETFQELEEDLKSELKGKGKKDD